MKLFNLFPLGNMKEKGFWLTVLLSFLLFSYFFNTDLFVFETRVRLSYICVFGTILYNYKYLLKILENKKKLKFICFICGLALYSSLLVYLNDLSHSFEFSMICFKIIGSVIFSSVVIDRIIPNLNFNIQSFVFNSVVFNSILVLLSLGFSDFRAFLESILFQGDSNINYLINPISFRGLAAGGGASLSVFMSLGILMGIISFEQEIIKKEKLIAGVCVIFISQFVVGRTGVVFSIFILSAWFIIQLFSKNRERLKMIFWIYFCIGLISLYIYIYQVYLFNYAFELFINLFKGNGLSSSSSDDTLSMIKLPNFTNLETLLFGFGFYETKESYRSDSGYLKTLFSLGVPLSLFLYVYLFKCYVIDVGNFLCKGKIYWMLGGSFFLIMELKEPFLYQNYSARFFVFMYILSVTNFQNEKIEVA